MRLSYSHNKIKFEGTSDNGAWQVTTRADYRPALWTSAWQKNLRSPSAVTYRYCTQKFGALFEWSAEGAQRIISSTEPTRRLTEESVAIMVKWKSDLCLILRLPTLRCVSRLPLRPWRSSRIISAVLRAICFSFRWQTEVGFFLRATDLFATEHCQILRYISKPLFVRSPRWRVSSSPAGVCLQRIPKGSHSTVAVRKHKTWPCLNALLTRRTSKAARGSIETDEIIGRTLPNPDNLKYSRDAFRSPDGEVGGREMAMVEIADVDESPGCCL